MISQEELLERVISRVSDKVAETIKETLSEVILGELSSAMTKALVEKEFLLQMNEEMRTGLRDIYQEIASVSKEETLSGEEAGKTHKLFSDTTKQLEEIMKTTFEAAEKIMTTAESLISQQEEAGSIIASLEVGEEQEKALSRLDELNNSLESSLTNIITDLSFQDLTGQRLKKVVSAIGSIRETVFDLYMSTGLMMKTHQEAPEKNLTEIAEDSRRKVQEIRNSELKGPQRESSQKDVDDLLSSLGL